MLTEAELWFCAYQLDTGPKANNIHILHKQQNIVPEGLGLQNDIVQFSGISHCYKEGYKES